MSLDAFFRHELLPQQRIPFVILFVLVGLVISAQVAQLPEKPPARWARLTDESRWVFGDSSFHTPDYHPSKIVRESGNSHRLQALLVHALRARGIPPRAGHVRHPEAVDRGVRVRRPVPQRAMAWAAWARDADGAGSCGPGCFEEAAGAAEGEDDMMEMVRDGGWAGASSELASRGQSR